MALLTAKTKYGTIEGVRIDDGITVFRGVPYAKPPVGLLRWKRPVPPELWKGVKKADKFAPKPIQGGGGEPVKEYPAEEELPESEDCLYLNIWTPAESENEKLPVMMWVPGGGFMTGNAASKMFHGEGFCRKGVILVTMMHRTGALGFMSHPLLADENGQSGNYALYDLIAAVNWIHDNIGAFGGDSDNVTIAGQSSGEVAVQVLLQVPEIRGKFRHAIMQSGRALDSGDVMDSAESALWKGENLMKVMGANTLEEMHAIDPQELFTALQKQRRPRKEVESEQDNPGRMLYHVDGEAMLDLLDEAAVNGLNADVDVMIGSCMDESGGDSAKIRANSCIVWAENQLRLGRKPSYLYMFARKRPDDPMGASHTAEVAYQFGNLEGSFRAYTEEDYALSETMLSYWTNFAKTGDPNGDGLPQWRPYTADRKVRMRLDIDSSEERL